ncbi:unnamed protein product [Pleuronectes platessa]|uniref:Uncharacterized protein n=1 Tax=Pleuronectes platessa TaxID=8262 RepID=A0A9N7TUV1_PLEPL|nr:unnamed protein product [Pleuronectes platessa]
MQLQARNLKVTGAQHEEEERRQGYLFRARAPNDVIVGCVVRGYHTTPLELDRQVIGERRERAGANPSRHWAKGGEACGDALDTSPATHREQHKLLSDNH